MGIKGKLEVEIDISCHCDILHELFSKRPHNLCYMSPSYIHSCDVHEGEFGKSGSIIVWNYTLDGKKCVAKEIVDFDEENKVARFKFIEGDLLNEFKSFTLVVQVIPKDAIIAGLRWTAEFEMLDDQVNYPTKFMNLCVEATKDIEAHHLNN